MAFETTQWSLVVNAGLDDSGAREALGELCRIYWGPLYLYLRHKGMDHEDASDAVQGFFVHIMEHDVAAKADPERGRFRTFLLTALNNFVSNERQKQHAQKRGGSILHTPLDTQTMTGLSDKLQSQSHLSPEEAFERQWAIECTRQALDSLRQDYMRRGALDLFDCIRPALNSDGDSIDYTKAAEKLGMNEGAVRVAVLRLRKRYANSLMTEINRTVSDPALAQEELRYLISILSG